MRRILEILINKNLESNRQKWIWICFAINGSWCLEKIVENPGYKILFWADIHMPEMDGLTPTFRLQNLVVDFKSG